MITESEIARFKSDGWTVEKTVCAGYEIYQDPCYILTKPDGERWDMEGDYYGYDAGDNTEIEAWERLARWMRQERGE